MSGVEGSVYIGFFFFVFGVLGAKERLAVQPRSLDEGRVISGETVVAQPGPGASGFLGFL